MDVDRIVGIGPAASGWDREESGGAGETLRAQGQQSDKRIFVVDRQSGTGLEHSTAVPSRVENSPVLRLGGFPGGGAAYRGKQRQARKRRRKLVAREELILLDAPLSEVGVELPISGCDNC